MTAAQKAAQKALSLVGQGYIYGAKGQICTQTFRQQQAQQYPDQAQNILGTGVKWDGTAVWDCAQLTREAAKAAGFSLVSGATSQWNKTEWVCKGTIDTLPENATAFVYRQADGKMQHTGVAIGDGTCVHARGTAYGVVRQSMSEYAWTHWAALWQVEQTESPMDGLARVWAANGSTVNMRLEPGGRILQKLPIGEVVHTGATSAGWTAVRFENEQGYMQSAFLKTDALMERIKQLETRLEKAGL